MLDHRYAKQSQDASAHSKILTTIPRVRASTFIDGSMLSAPAIRPAKENYIRCPSLRQRKSGRRKSSLVRYLHLLRDYDMTDPVVQGSQRLARSPSLSATTTWRSSLTMRSKLSPRRPFRILQYTYSPLLACGYCQTHNVTNS